MPYKNPVVQFFGKQKSGKVSPSKVPYREEEDRPFTAKINDGKRRQLETILDKEKRKEKRERVGTVLIQRLVDKFGSKNKAIVNFFVEEFLNSSADMITFDDVNVLEREIANAINVKNKNYDGTANAPKRSEPQTTQVDFEVQADPTTRPSTGSEWQVLNAYQTILGEEQDKKDREKAWAKKMTFRKSLDQQINAASSLRNNNGMTDQQYAQHIYKDIDVYHQQEAQKHAMTKKKCTDETLIRRKQIEDKERRLAEERENFRIIEEQNLQRAKDILARENELIAAKKAKEQARRKQIEFENAENDRRKAEQKILDAQNDQRLMAEYAAKLDNEQRARENAFNKRMAEMEANGHKFESEGAGKAIREERLRTEQLLLKEQRRKEESDLAKERKKEEDRQRRVAVALAENKRQLQRREQMLIEERNKDMELRERFQADVDAYQRSEEEKLRKLRERQEKYRNTLNSQMEATRQNMKTLTITEHEKNINMPTLREISADPHMMSRVMHRVRISTSSHGLKPK